MRSPAVLLTPLFVGALVAVAVALGHAAVRRTIASATAASPWRLPGYRRLAVGCGIVGRVVLGAGALMLVAYAYLSPRLLLYPLVTPAVLAAGAALTSYGATLDALLGRRRSRVAAFALYTVLATSLLWGTSTLAQYSGRGAAIALAAHLATERPAVILDTKERLYLPTTTVVERVLPPGTDQAFHYRYRNLRLLIQGKDRLFLVPSPWSPGDPTLAVPLDGEVRVQFQR
jgi:hypothetical protein